MHTCVTYKQSFARVLHLRHMKFGKLEDISSVDFSLPPDHANNEAVLMPLSVKPATLYVGSTGWSMPEWKGTYYPTKAPAKDFAKHYSHQWNSIEFNTTHYRIPATDTVLRWLTETADDFVFCPKIYKYISHTKDLGKGREDLTRYIDTMALLEYKLGPMFMQLPPYFDVSRLPVLEDFLDRWPAGLPLAVELRHASWYATEGPLDSLQALLAAKGHSLLLTDVSGRRDMLHMRLCGNYLMVRWVGNGLHPTDYTRIAEWRDRLTAYVQMGVEKIYFFTHEPDNILAPDIAAYLCKAVADVPLLSTRGPKLLGDDSQLKLF